MKIAFDERPDVIVCDLLIPVLDGRDIYRMVSQVSDYKPVFILYSTINDDDIVKDILKFRRCTLSGAAI